VGSAGQKTWNVRRPVTLIGSRRPAHIVLHDRDVLRAHCVIVNTGTDVLLKDLHTTTGTFCDNKRVDGITVLRDGDIVAIGATKLQIAIQVPENQTDDSACGIEFVEPAKFRNPLTVRLDHTETQWQIEDAVAMIGRLEEATIRLDHEDVSTRHAVLFRFAGGPAIFDLGSRNGVWIRGERFPCATLHHEGGFKVGPCALTIVSGSTASPRPSLPAPGTAEEREAGPGGTTGGPADQASDALSPPPAGPSHGISKVLAGPGGHDDRSPAEALTDIESELVGLQRNLASSWDRLNSWHTRLLEDATKLTHKESDLATREAELDSKDAALRGQLHDLTRWHEQITAREQELAAQLARIQTQQEELGTAQAALAEKEAELGQRAEDLKRREHVLAQRWTRLMAATCSHCGRPVSVRNPGAAETSP
jgi:pSer/pThr/pTyr-binding forkhead associated (FHA) protein